MGFFGFFRVIYPSLPTLTGLVIVINDEPSSTFTHVSTHSVIAQLVTSSIITVAFVDIWIIERDENYIENKKKKRERNRKKIIVSDEIIFLHLDICGNE